MVTACQLLTDKLWHRSTDVVALEKTSSGVSRYLLTTFSAFCSQGKGRLDSEIIQCMMAPLISLFLSFLRYKLYFSNDKEA